MLKKLLFLSLVVILKINSKECHEHAKSKTLEDCHSFCAKHLHGITDKKVSCEGSCSYNLVNPLTAIPCDKLRLETGELSAPITKKCARICSFLNNDKDIKHCQESICPHWIHEYKIMLGSSQLTKPKTPKLPLASKGARKPVVHEPKK